MSRLDARIAARYMRSRRSSRLVSLITVIATGGVLVGVTALIVVTGVINGLQDELRAKILVASPHLRVLTYGQGLRIDDWEPVLERIREHPGVVAAVPMVLTQGLLSAGADYVEGVNIIGLDPDTGAISVLPLPRHFTRGDLTFATTRPDVEGGIVLGRRLAERVAVFEGDKVTVVSPPGSKFNAALGTIVPRYWEFEVVGRFDTGMHEYDNSYAILPIDVARRFAALDDAVSGIDVRVADPERAGDVGIELEAMLGHPFRTLDWKTQNSALHSALQLEKLAMGTILLLIVVVAAFNIVSTLTMLVTEKTREIGILRAMGLPARAVKRIFIMQGAVIGVVGTALGTGLGLLLAYLVDTRRLIRIDPSVYFIDHLPVQVDPMDLTIIVVASFAVATIATLYPARQAAALHPVDAIRYE
jgi:lipoprotein-releasing system permease protein